VRALLQLGLIAVLGVVTSYVLERFKEANQQRRDVSRLRFDVLTELSRAYMDVKLLRRKVQVSHGAFTATDADLLNEIQVKFELHKRNSVSLFDKNSELKDRLDKIEKYLNHVANKDNSEERRGFSSKEGFKDFADTFEAAAALIRKEIAGRLFGLAPQGVVDTSRRDACGSCVTAQGRVIHLDVKLACRTSGLVLDSCRMMPFGDNPNVSLKYRYETET
jgi:hypothetical protein